MNSHNTYINNCYFEPHPDTTDPIFTFLPNDQVRICLHDMAIVPLAKYEKLCAASDTTTQPESPKSDNFEHAMQLVGK